MSDKLISANNLAQFVKNWGNLKGREESADSFLYAINNAPAVDAVEVVRCRDCIFSNFAYGAGVCLNYPQPIYRNGFCHKGERRKDIK